MSHISSGSCIKFKKRTNEPNYVHFQATKSGCYSNVGYIGTRQVLNLAKGCQFPGIIIHEIMHALGFLHMQSSFDRDKYVEILWENIEPGNAGQFEMMGDNVVSHMGGEYDYSSIMHYAGKSFSQNGKLTIKTKDPSKQNVIGNRKGMSKEDKQKLNYMYECT
ncbi:zinc metalloproteinase nas-13-like [Sitodiplosis mosellana]|uniref:zinc metalloproteinase nas-13-like n=1 Tax=Sitodiplosis mosellana TaxID=263140 RepID=UPI002444288B|nr:zinc metalloproteinase nas-13-like [Sitodiplosis mosellana]